MKKIYLLSLLLLGAMSITGCSVKAVPAFQTSKQFHLKPIHLKFSEHIKPDIKYHTAEEIEELLNMKINQNLQSENLLSSDPKMDDLTIDINYERRFVGDETSFPSDSLAGPKISFDITVTQGQTRKGVLSQDDSTLLTGNFFKNFVLIFGIIRGKEDEVDFIDTLAELISNKIETLI